MAGTGVPPEAAGGLRPAEAGVVLDRGPRPAHVVATVIDLAQRGWLGIEALDASGDADWVFTRSRTPARWLARRRGLARYERLLLRGVFGRRSQVRFTRIVSVDIRRVYRRLTRDALAQGWLAPTAPDATPDTDAEELRAELRALRVALNGLRPPPGVDELPFYSSWLPYAVAFGLMPVWAQRLDVLGAPAIPSSGSGASYPGPDVVLMAWWNRDFANRMTGAVGDWSHHSGGSDGAAGGHHGGGFGHHSGHGGHHGFDGGHHGGHDGGSW
ncbi:hypothetical protein [Streptomyces sp. CA-111067]|uniref:hypothetical protein n=1 Tax=Streptomyces sp. CA-111067 TaxID=3240046 RepID=UPI003D973C37